MALFFFLNTLGDALIYQEKVDCHRPELFKLQRFVVHTQDAENSVDQKSTNLQGICIYQKMIYLQQ